MHVKALKQPLRVMSPPDDVGKRLQPCSKEATVVSFLSPTREVPKVVPIQTVTKAVSIFSEEKKLAVDEVFVCNAVTMEEVAPLSGLSLQLKKYKMMLAR
jgi:hypothetical protein